MTERWLRRLYALIVVGLLAWPVPHYYLTRALVSDPWKNLGLAMYATYFEIGVKVRFRTTGDEWSELGQDDPLWSEIDTFVEQRRSRGRLREPRAVAEVLRGRDRAREVHVLVVSRQLDGVRGQLRRIDREIYEYSFETDASEAPPPHSNPVP